jgi:hypothetical protein
MPEPLHIITPVIIHIPKAEKEETNFLKLGFGLYVLED